MIEKIKSVKGRDYFGVSNYRKVHECQNGVELGFGFGSIDDWKVYSFRDNHKIKSLELDGQWVHLVLRVFKANLDAFVKGEVRESFVFWFFDKFLRLIPKAIDVVENVNDPCEGSEDEVCLRLKIQVLQLIHEYEENHRKELSEVRFPYSVDFEVLMMSLWMMMISEQNKLLEREKNGVAYFVPPILGFVLKVIAFTHGFINYQSVLKNQGKFQYEMENGYTACISELFDEDGSGPFMERLTCEFLAQETYASSIKRQNKRFMGFNFDSDLMTLQDFQSKAPQSFRFYLWDSFCNYLKREDVSRAFSYFNLDVDFVINEILLPRCNISSGYEYRMKSLISPEKFGFC